LANGILGSLLNANITVDHGNDLVRLSVYLNASDLEALGGHLYSTIIEQRELAFRSA
jgi:hypothetical protein